MHRPACVLVACVYVWFILMFAALMVVHTRQARPTQVLPRPRSLSSQVGQYLGCAERRPVSEARRSDEGADRHRLDKDDNTTIPPRKRFLLLLMDACRG